MADTLETIMSKLPPERQESIKARAEELINDESGLIDLDDSTDLNVQKIEPAKSSIVLK